MSQPDLFSWLLDPDEAVRVQPALRERLALTWNDRDVTTIGGVDASLGEGQARAVECVLKCCTQYRLPEPTRWAHRVAGGEKLPTGAAQVRLI